MNIYTIYGPENHFFAKFTDYEQAERVAEFMNEFYSTYTFSDKQYHVELEPSDSLSNHSFGLRLRLVNRPSIPLMSGLG